MNPAKKLIAFILSVSMLVSLCPSFSVTFTAETMEQTETTTELIKNFITEYGEILSDEYSISEYPPKAVITNDSAIVYESVHDNAKGVQLSAVNGLQIWLEQCFVYSNGQILYRYSLVDNSVDAYSTSLTYQFISANDISIVNEDVQVSTDVPSEETGNLLMGQTSSIEATETLADLLITDGVSATVVENKYFSKEEEISATINKTPITIYENNLAATALGVVVDNVLNEPVTLVQKVTYSNGVILYRYEYYGTHEILSSMVQSYGFISADDVTLSSIEEEIPTVDQTLTDPTTGIEVSGSLPQGVSLAVSVLSDAEMTTALTTEYYTYPKGEKTVGFDIKLIRNGVEYQPTEPVTLVFSNEDIYFGKYTGYVIYHIQKDNVKTVGPFKSDTDGITLTVDNFSKFIFANLFEETGEYVWEGEFLKSPAYAYVDFIHDTPVYTIENATETTIKTTKYYTDYNGNTWYLLSKPFFDDNYNVYGWVKSEDLFIPEITVVDENTGISVKGVMPKDVTASVSALSQEDMKLDTEVYELGSDTVAYDISLQKNGANYTPNAYVDVNFPASMFNAEKGTKYTGYHVHDDGTVDVLGTYEYTGEDIVVTVDSFSEFVFTSIVTEEDLSIEEIFGIPTTDELVYFDTELVATFIDNSVKLYSDWYGTYTTEVVVEGVKGEEIRVIAKVEYSKGKTLYFFDYAGNNTDLANSIYNYQFILADGVDFGFTDDDSDIKVLGEFPYESTLLLTEKNHTLDSTLYPMGEHTKTLDISIIYDGAKYQPEKPVTISIPQEKMEIAEKTGMVIYHVHDDGTVDIIGPVFSSTNGINLTVDSFSEFVFTDTFPEASNKRWAGIVNKDSINVYTDYFSQNYTIQTGMLNTVVRGDAFFIDSNGETWLLMNKPITTNDNTVYAWVKSEDVVFTRYDGDYIMPSVDFTEVGHIQSTGIYSNSNISTFSRNLSTVNDIVSLTDTDSSDNLKIDKHVSGPDNDGQYTITLEAWVTGAVTTKTQSMPTDIILVLDQSGSMSNSDSYMDSTRYTSLVGNTASGIFNSYEDNVYKLINGKYYPVTITRTTATGESKDNYLPVSTDATNWDIAVYYPDNLYYKVADNDYRKVTVTTGYNYTYSYDGETLSAGDWWDTPSWASEGKLYYLDSENNTTSYNYVYTYAYTDENGVSQIASETFSANHSMTADNNFYRLQVTGQSNIRRIDALKTAVNSFVTSVNNDAKGKDGQYGTDDDIKHRISIVGFGSESGYGYNTEILTVTGSNSDVSGGTVSKIGVRYATNISNATYYSSLQDVTTSNGRTMVDNAIKALAGEGATRVDLGLTMANKVIDAAQEQATANANNESFEYKYKNDQNETIRNKVVIVFTDGDPTNGSSYQESVANSALVQSRNIKFKETTVYSIGVMDGADARISFSSDKKTADIVSQTNSNKFLHYLSSNYKPATSNSDVSMTNPGSKNFPTRQDSQDATQTVYTGASYYLSASSSDALSNIFQQLATAVGGTTSTLSTSTVVKDIIAPNFTLPNGVTADNIGSKVKVYTADYVAADTFDEDNWESLADANVTLTGTDTIDVKGFNFSENWVGTVTDASGEVEYRGKKLIIEIPIEVDEFFLGGNNVDTNKEGSGIYANAEADTALKEFVNPDVDIKLLPIDISWQNQHIYITNAADIQALFANAIVTSNSGSTAPLSAVLNGENNAYVDLAFEITGPDFKATYTLDKTHAFDAGDLSVENGTVTPILNADTVYTLKWQVIPDPSAESLETGIQPSEVKSIDATVYVYKPEITFKDTGVYYDGVTTVSAFDENYVSHTWVGSQAYVADNMHDYDSSAAINHKVPGFIFTYSPTSVGVSPTDTYVNVTVATTGTDNPRVLSDTATEDLPAEVTFKHSDCTGETFDASKGEFIVHVYRPVLTFTDSYEVFGDALSVTSDYYNTVNNKNDMNNIVWEPVTNGITVADADFVNNKPDLSLSYSPEYTGWVSDGIVTADSDFYVYVTVKAGDNDITDVTRFVHQNIQLPSDTHTECLYEFESSKGEFIVHIDILETDLTITKTVSAEYFDVDASFVFTVMSFNKENEQVEISVIIPGRDFVLNDDNYTASVVIDGLKPTKGATVSEDTSWSWRYKVNTPINVITNLVPQKGQNKVSFVNVLDDEQWLTAEAYVENIFNTVSESNS